MGLSTGSLLAGTAIEFEVPIHVDLAGPCRELCVGDFNNDGKLDLAVAVSGTRLSILTNDGSGVLCKASHNINPLEIHSITSGDFDGDKNLDLVTVMGNSVTIWLGNGDGSFRPSNFGFTSFGDANGGATGDFDQDGNLDLLVLCQFEFLIFSGKGNGTFDFLTNQSAGQYCYSIATGDFNGDTDLDLVTANYSYSSMSVFRGASNSTFASSTNYGGDFSEYHYAVVVGDFNGDGKPDLATGNFYGSSLSVRLNNGLGYFGAERKFPLMTCGVVSLAIGDFNGDGNLDILSGNVCHSLALLPGNGDGTFATAITNFPSLGGFGNQTVAVADFNDDGKPDIVSTLITNNSVTVFLNRSSPALRIRGANPIELSWPDWAGYHLQFTTQLANSSPWAEVMEVPVAVNGQKRLRLPANQEAGFFRLKKF